MLFSPGWRANHRQGTVLTAFSIGLLLGGLLSSMVIWILSGLTAPLPDTARAIVVISIAGIALAREVGLVKLPLPQNARQIPREVLDHSVLAGSLQFGFELGTGVRTFVSASAPYALALGLLFSHQDLLPVLLTGVAFGGGRAMSAASAYWSRDPERSTLVLARVSLIKYATAITTLVAFTLLMLPAG